MRKEYNNRWEAPLVNGPIFLQDFTTQLEFAFGELIDMEPVNAPAPEEEEEQAG